MSVEIHGQIGYDYQYLVSAYLAVKYIEKDNIEIYVESENGEDLQLGFSEEGEQYIIDVQVKHRETQVDLKEFANWVSHFDKNSHTQNLFTKLKQNKNRFVSYYTNARCNDDVSKFINNKDSINASLNTGLSNTFLKKLKVKILETYTDEKTLSNKRKNFLEWFLEKNNNNAFRNILKRNKVYDLFSFEDVKENLKRILNKSYAVPESEIISAINELLLIVREEKGSGVSITEIIIDVLEKYRGTRIFRYDEYKIHRQEKEYCLDYIKKSNALLLTGSSLCGKTYLAEEIGQNYQEQGYNVKITGELSGDEGALTFFRHSTKEDRLLILDDPFGSITKTENSLEALRKVSQLINNSTPSKKIIVTSRTDILLGTMGKTVVSDCNLSGTSWYDLTVDNFDFMENLWTKYFGSSSSSMNILNNVSHWLSINEGVNSLQPGQIELLFNEKKNLESLQELSAVSIIDLARIDSKQLAEKIGQRGGTIKKLFIALGLSSNTLREVSINDLTFILSNTSEKPSLIDDREPGKEMTFKTDFEDQFPKYEKHFDLSEDFKQEIKYLNSHGYIYIDKIKRSIIFTHPIYHHASKILFAEGIDDLFDSAQTLSYAESSLSSLSKNSSMSALSTLEWYYNLHPVDSVKKIIFKSIYSIFPSVKDRSIEFFDDKLEILNDDEERELIRSVKFQEKVEESGILWRAGEAYYNPSNKRNIFAVTKLDKNIYILLEKAKGDETLTPEEIWNLLDFGEDLKNEELTLRIAKLGLTYDESFIREKAVFHLFSNHMFNLEENIDVYLDYSEHPNVIFMLFRGALNSWDKYSDKNKKLILTYFKESLSIIPVAVRSIKFLENFYDEYKTDSIEWSKLNEENKTSLWLTWYEVFIELLNKFPSKQIRLNEPHMVEVATSSLKYVDDKELIVDLANTWLNWLNNYWKYNTAHDYGMSVASYLMEGTGSDSTIREPVFKELLKQPNTNFITTNIFTFIYHWDQLSEGEKREIYMTLNSTREDLNWIRAVALNSNKVPTEIQTAIFNEEILENGVTVIVDKLIEFNLLETGINVHTGYPQPLWWNGYHHNNYKLWDRIIVEVLERKSLDKSFELVLKEFIDCLYNHNTQRFDYPLYVKLVQSDSETRIRVFSRLLIETIQQNQANKKMWNILLSNSSKKEIENFLDTIAYYIEGVQYAHSSYNDLFDIFDREVINAICNRIITDKKILIFCNKVTSLFNTDIDLDVSDKKMEEFRQMSLQFVVKSFKEAYSEAPPKMTFTNKTTLFTLKDLKIQDQELLNLVESNRRRLVHEGSATKTKLTDHYELDNWFE
ncbi:hypothetical protein [Halobacillus seohaensis]|uniref:Novel STAND NTPase 3 domain-containing protein n=1 Tax=Halobacillus seohaensis TaxID=447421 RepID=A0ABW2EP47_9BACI